MQHATTDLIPPSEPGAALDLAAQNRALRSRMAALLEQAERNQAIMSRHQAFDLEIVGAGNFPELIGTIFRTLPIISDLESVTLSLLDEEADIRAVMGQLGVDFDNFPGLVLADREADLGFLTEPGGAQPKPLLGPFDPAKHGTLFAAGVQSVARVPLLRNKRLIGSLNLASIDPGRFTPALGTDFIEHMASIIAICLENVISNEMLKYIGLTDSLTGVYNRRYIDRRLLEELGRAQRQQYQIACLYIDIDHFKRINDNAGHQGGDEVLREVASRIKAELRLSDALGRFGGEEFVALLIDADLASAGLVAERIRAGIADQLFQLAGGVTVAVSVSIGVASLRAVDSGAVSETTAQQLIARADAALYQAKEGGRNRVVSLSDEAVP